MRMRMHMCMCASASSRAFLAFLVGLKAPTERPAMSRLLCHVATMEDNFGWLATDSDAMIASMKLSTRTEMPV